MVQLIDFSISYFLGLECPPLDVPSGDVDFSPGGRFPPTKVVVVVMVVEGDIEVPPLFEGHQDFKADPTEGVAFEYTGFLLEDTTELEFSTVGCY